MYRIKSILAVLSAAVTGFPSSILASVPADLNNPDIPWQDLRDGLSTEATLLSASSQNYTEQCFPEFNLPFFERTNFRLRNQTAGVCMVHLACGIAENCFPPGNNWDKWQEVKETRESFAESGLSEEELNNYFVEIGWIQGLDDWMDPAYLPFNIPSSVIFPAVAGDVVAAVKFAGDNGLELSVKASGHNYAGASGKKDTLLVNTFRYKKYAPTGIVECAADGVSLPKEGQVDQDLANQACLLALARKKEAFIRVGGGEAWIDVYRSLREFNEAQETSKYHAVGGGAASVTPMGWTFQGGLSGNGGARLYGLGVDQVLQIEAILPNGEHVRFGPTSWEDQGEGFLYPRTTAVSGVCNMNPKGDEEDWKWEACLVDINFEDLWFAFRGGGGGTWGIVLSVYLQLHEYLPLEVVDYSMCWEVFTPEMHELFYGYALEYLLDPAALGISPEESNSCGSLPAGPFTCYGEGTGQKFVSTWKLHLQNSREELLGKNITEDQIVASAGCINVVMENRDMVDMVLVSGLPALYPTHVDDGPIPIYNFLVPMSSYLESKDFFAKLFLETGWPYMSFGSNVVLADDQTTSISKSYRNPAFMLFIDGALLQTMLDLYGISSEDTDIPAFFGGNHFTSWQYGPLKSDPTKVCAFASLAEANEKCHPVQAAIWGSENLARLEKIKKEIDPNYMFDCNKCVGNNRMKSVSPDPSPPTTSVSGGGANEVYTTNDIEEDPPDEPTIDVELDLGSDNVEDSGGFGMWHPIKDYLFIAAVVVISFVV